MNDYDALRQETLALLDELIEIARRSGADETERRLVAARALLADGGLLTVVCGEFKRGKSSLLNALLEEPGLLPVDDYFATSLVTTVSYGTQERVTVHLAAADGSLREQPISRDELASYVTEGGNPGNAKGVRGVVIEIPSPRLASGLRLVDTPGIGGVYAEHSAATAAALPGAHAIIFVTDATQPLAKSELHFLRGAAETASLLGERDALLFVLTKTDLVSDYSELLANTRRKLAEVTGWPPDQVTVIPVSSQARLDYLSGGDPADLELSNFAALEDYLWGALTRRRAAALLSRALDDLERSARALLQPVDEETELLTDRTAQRAEESRRASQDRQRRLDELRAGDAAWRRDLARAVAGIAREVQVTAMAGVDDVWHRLRVEYLHDPDLLADTDKLVNQLTDDMIMVISTANRLLDERAARLQRDFATRNHLDLGHAEIGRLPEPPVSGISARADVGAQDRPGTLLRNWRDISTGSTLGSVLGAVVGGLIGQILIPIPGAGAVLGASIAGAIGGVAGGALGLRASAKAVRQQDHEARRRSLQLTLEPFYREHRRHIEAAVPAVADDFTIAITAELDSRIAQERDSAAESARRAKEASQTDAASVQERLTRLAAERAPLDRCRRRVTELIRAAAALAARPPAAGQPAEEQQAPGHPVSGDPAAGEPAAGPAAAAAESGASGTDGAWADEQS
jgi:hypothetical protein